MDGQLQLSSGRQTRLGVECAVCTSHATVDGDDEFVDPYCDKHREDAETVKVAFYDPDWNYTTEGCTYTFEWCGSGGWLVREHRDGKPTGNLYGAYAARFANAEPGKHDAGAPTWDFEPLKG